MSSRIKTIFINKTLNNNNSFNYTINLGTNNQVKYNILKIKTVSYYNNGADNNIYTIVGDILGSKTLSLFQENRGTQSVNFCFKHELINFVDNSSYNFYFYDNTGTNINLTGQFIIVLEFKSE